jgi:Cu+-exporting ATPase
VDQSYLTQLWNNAAFQKEKEHPPTALAEAFSKYFTLITLFIATITGIYWAFTDTTLVWPTVTAVLMVACPCALTLALPFAMNTSLGILGLNKFYVKNQQVLQKLTEVTAFIFDKTGTLTSSQQAHISYQGEPLTPTFARMILGIAEQSSHPLSKAIATYMREDTNVVSLAPESSKETPGFGIEGWAENIHIQIGQARWIAADFEDTDLTSEIGSRVYIGKDGKVIGYYSVQPRFRHQWQKVLVQLQKSVQTILLSGDDVRQERLLEPYFSKENRLFNQKPIDKLTFVREKQAQGAVVCMIGDGLNDTGALQQSDVGIAISEEVHVFTPAADALLDATSWEKLPLFLAFAKDTVRVVQISFLFSLVYNIIGISWAVTGTLSPVIAAIFMPLSSLSVVLIAVGLTYWKARVYHLNT